VRFEKWQALGNDYLIIESSELAFELTAPRIRRLCDHHLGVGSDGILLLSPSDGASSVASLRICNPDGSEAELSGNGARQAALYLRRRGWTEDDEFVIDTIAGPIRPQILTPTTARMDIGKASTTSPAYPSGDATGRGTLTAGGATWEFQHVSIGNPQCAIRLEDLDQLEALDLQAIGPEIERNELFPHRTNVSWFVALDPATIRTRIFERGVGETLASGTGASGAAVAHVLSGGASPVTVRLDGGELLAEVAQDLAVHLTGWAVPVYEGILAPEMIEELSGS
jgi:diaminopimelate epimerase